MGWTKESKAAHRRACTKAECWCRRHGRPTPNLVWPGNAVFLDGESYDDGFYAVLQTYDPRDGVIHTTRALEGRLSSSQCLSHLFLSPKAEFFGFGLKYDISNWLTDLPAEALTRLRQHGFVRWREWKLDYLPGKLFKACDRTRAEGDRQRVVWDLHPFFQQSFIGALEASSLEVPDIIRLGKRLRGRFSRANSEFVEAYNEAELRGMHNLYTSLCRTLEAGDCKIRYWFGPGSCARLKAKQQGVTIAADQLTSFLAARRDLAGAGMETEETLIARELSPHACVVDAFFGGRFELSQQGPVAECWEYDLSSAYPWALASGMPCFACGGEWKSYDFVPGTLPEAMNKWSIWLVTWAPKPPPGGGLPMWGPFPVRMTRNLAWPSSGWGWFHRCEVDAAVEHLSHLYDVQVHKGWAWHPACAHDPWAWVGAAVAERVAIKHTNPGKAQCLKLSLNSLYGITADKAGIDSGRIPRYHNPYWAGLITARTRARLLHAAALGGDDIVYLATDGVHSRRPLALPTGPKPGDWETPTRAGVPAVFLAPGTYLYADGARGKSRGINIGKFSTDIRTWERLYRLTAPNGKINLLEKHFSPFVEALSRSGGQDNDHYRSILNTWSTRPRELSYDLSPRRKRREDGRWVAPTYTHWKMGAQLGLIGSDAAMRAEEAYAGYQPEHSIHKLIASASE